MHIPDGYLNLPSSVSAAVIATGGVGVSLRKAKAALSDRVVPLAGLAAAFIFVLQMLNFPIAGGTSGHFLGGALAAILLGPSVGVVVIAVVIIVQGLVFADGGISALGLNVINMALVTAIVGWLVFRGLMAVLPKTATSAVAATALASWSSVVAASVAFTGEYAIGGGGQVPVSRVFGAMVGVHALVGIGEGILSGLVVSSVLATRPDLVLGARIAGVRGAQRSRVGKTTTGIFIGCGVAVAALLVVVVAPHAASTPDGLERVAIDHGISGSAVDSVTASSPLADYAVSGVGDEALGTILAGLVGLGVTFALGASIMQVVSRRSHAPEAAQRGDSP
jgi:cobalt/nickel transport system permease protein